MPFVGLATSKVVDKFSSCSSNLKIANLIYEEALKYKRDVYVAFNRRHYASTRNLISELNKSNDLRYIHIYDQENPNAALTSGQPEIVVKNWMYANSIHLIDFVLLLGRGNIRNILNIVPLIDNYILTKIEFDSGDIVIYESLTSTSLGNEVYRGTSTNVTIPTNSIATRWITVRTRDKWDDLNKTDTGPLPVTPLNPDPDTTYTVDNPATASASASIDPKDLSGFSLVSTITWAQSINPKTAGYAIRWSTNNPDTAGVTPLWEYASVSGINTLSFTATTASSISSTFFT